MRSIIIGAMLLFLTACAQTRLPDSVNVTDWQDFGKQSALDGLIELSEDRIVKLDDTNRATPELIMAYQSGYQEGKKSTVSKVLICLAYEICLTLAFVMILTRFSNKIMNRVELLPLASISQNDITKKSC